MRDQPRNLRHEKDEGGSFQNRKACFRIENRPGWKQRFGIREIGGDAILLVP